MAVGDILIDGGPLACGCAKFVATATYRPWQGRMYMLWNDARTLVTKVLYFRNHKIEYVKKTPPDPEDTFGLFIPELFACSTDPLTYGQQTSTVTNPDGMSPLFNPVLNPLRLSQMSQPGDYVWKADTQNELVLQSFTPGPKYSIRFTTLTGIIRIARGGFRFSRIYEDLYSNEFTEPEFDAVLRTYLNDSAFSAATYRITRTDRFPCVQIAPSTPQWSNAGHACRAIKNFEANDPAVATEGQIRGLGILRKSTVKMPGQHCVHDHASGGYTTYPGGGAINEFGLKTLLPFGNVYPFPVGGPNYFGPVLGCQNITIPCDGGYFIDAPATNRIREWREGEVCPP